MIRIPHPAIVLFALLITVSTVSIGAELTPERKREVVQIAAEKLERNYVHPEIALAMSKDLRERLAAGEYDNVEGIEQFSELLTQHLRSVSNDEHLRIAYTDSPIRTAQDLSNPTLEEEIENQAMLGNL